MARLRAPALLLLALSLVPGCKDDDPGTCPDGQTFCNGVCRDAAYFLTSDTDCGACLVACGLGTCAGGSCQCDAGADLCAQGNPRCVDLQTDEHHCGACGAACTKPGARCEGGICGCFAPADDDCGAYCTDTLSDPQSCGLDDTACGNACPLANEICAAGACACPSALPTACGGACVNTLTDPENCGQDAGSCGNACPLSNDVCVGGTCACPTALPDPCPSPTPSTCVNLDTDEANCGACGVRCAAGATCTPSGCACPGAQVVCGDACVDTETDERHCGGCGASCPTGATCTAGDCACPAGPVAGCGGACCAGGAACCGNGLCPPPHANGLGQTYYDCGAQDEHTLEQARLAAIAWTPTGTTYESGLCSAYCLCRQSTTQAAVWCYQGSETRVGLVQVTPSPNCLAANCPYPGFGVQWH